MKTIRPFLCLMMLITILPNGVAVAEEPIARNWEFQMNQQIMLILHDDRQMSVGLMSLKKINEAEWVSANFVASANSDGAFKIQVAGRRVRSIFVREEIEIQSKIKEIIVTPDNNITVGVMVADCELFLPTEKSPGSDDIFIIATNYVTGLECEFQRSPKPLPNMTTVNRFIKRTAGNCSFVLDAQSASSPTASGGDVKVVKMQCQFFSPHSVNLWPSWPDVVEALNQIQ